VKWFVMFETLGIGHGDDDHSGFAMFDDLGKALAFFDETKRRAGVRHSDVVLVEGSMLRRWRIGEGGDPSTPDEAFTAPDDWGAYAEEYHPGMPNTAWVVRVHSEAVSGWLGENFDFMRPDPHWTVAKDRKASHGFASKEEAANAANFMNGFPERFRRRREPNCRARLAYGGYVVQARTPAGVRFAGGPPAVLHESPGPAVRVDLVDRLDLAYRFPDEGAAELAAAVMNNNEGGWS
jgi:hypothetical protein